MDRLAGPWFDVSSDICIHALRQTDWGCERSSKRVAVAPSLQWIRCMRSTHACPYASGDGPPGLPLEAFGLHRSTTLPRGGAPALSGIMMTTASDDAIADYRGTPRVVKAPGEVYFIHFISPRATIHPSRSTYVYSSRLVVSAACNG